MLFKKTEDLRQGMRVARPIYNRNGTLLYERGSRLTAQGIGAMENFGLIGVYILEPGEPMIPMTEDDIEFERFQSIVVFAIRDELTGIFQYQRLDKFDKIVDMILAKYGYRNRKINFMQNIRSREDYFFKHAINVAILCAMMGEALKLKPGDKKLLVSTALLHDLGKLEMPPGSIGRENSMTVEEIAGLAQFDTESVQLVKEVLSDQPVAARIVELASRMVNDFRRKQKSGTPTHHRSVVSLAVAELFDTMTAMNVFTEPASQAGALMELLPHEDFFGKEVLAALMESVNFLPVGCCVELSNGEKGLVLQQNPQDILKPMVLTFKSNSIIDLSQPGQELRIKDEMKAMDIRHALDKEAVQAYTESLA